MPPLPSAIARHEDATPGLFWRWVWDSIRPVLGYVLVGLGLIALLIGWYGVSGEPVVAKQLPYVVSGGLFGVGLIVLGSRFLLMQELQRDSGRLDRLETMVLELHAVLLSRPDAQSMTAPAARRNGNGNGRVHAASAPLLSTYVALPGGTTYHEVGCPMLEGKEKATPLKSATAARRGLTPCPLCEPAVVAV